MIEHKKLNDDDLREDMKNYLFANIKSGKGFDDALAWLAEYKERIALNLKMIQDRFQEAFPKSVVKIEGGLDDNSCFYVKIYGKKDIYDLNNENIEKNGKVLNEEEIRKYYRDYAYDISEEFQKDFSKYCIMPSFVSIENTEKHYPEIFEELKLKLNT